MVRLILNGLQLSFSQNSNLVLKDTEKNVNLSLPPPSFSLLVLISLIDRFYFYSHIKNSFYILKLKEQRVKLYLIFQELILFFRKFTKSFSYIYITHIQNNRLKAKKGANLCIKFQIHRKKNVQSI